MRPLRALLAVTLATVPSVIPAQEGWNDGRTTTLVREAIARRAVQLADTGLLDYTARAHGYLTFLAQFGEGFPLPPAVVKSDELMVDLAWGAPDRSKQRIIGRRDTLLLPTDIAYHRDHLVVVQNNFPAIIRLGDGDEVRDVPHPLSEAGLATYDYRITDSLAIRAGDHAIDVMMVSVRPKDDRVAAAVGAVYIDRLSASVVRMTLSFTRAALRDRQLEDVSVILENGLVDGRFWLPRRQEIEIRRSVTWMDFPARGIIRGRWEICCIKTNAGVPPRALVGPEIVEAPLAEQRRFPFEGTVLGGLSEEFRAFDAEDVRRVQEEARTLVRAGALARARTASPSARRVSDLVRVDRAEGLALGLGVEQSLGAGFSLGASGRYGTADYRWKGRGTVAWHSARGTTLAIEARDDFALAGEVPEVSGLRNSLAAQEFGSDWTNPYGIAGGSVRLDLASRGRSGFAVQVSTERHRPLAVRGVPSSGAYEPTLSADPASLWRLAVEWRRAPSGDPAATAWDAVVKVGAVSADLAATGPSGTYGRLSGELGSRMQRGGWSLHSRTTVAALTVGAAIPLQDQVFFGGPVTGPGYGFHSLRGRIGVSERIELQRRIPFVAFNLGRFGRAPSTLVLAPFVHGTAVADRPGGAWGWSPSVGLGVIGIFDLFRLDVARALRGGGWLFTVDVSPGYWSVM